MPLETFHAPAEQEQPEKKVEVTSQEPQLVDFLGRQLWVDPRFVERFKDASARLPKSTTWELREMNGRKYILAVDAQKKELVQGVPYERGYEEHFIANLETAALLQHPELVTDTLLKNFQRTRNLPEKMSMALLEGINVKRFDKGTWIIEIAGERWVSQQMGPMSFSIDLSACTFIPSEDVLVLLEGGLYRGQKITGERKPRGSLVLSVHNRKLSVLRKGEGFVYEYKEKRE